MGGLLYKEFHQNRVPLLILYTLVLLNLVISIAGIQPFFFAEDSFWLPLPLLCLLTMIATAGMLPLIFRGDETRLWAAFVQSTPEAARGQVKSKYLFMLIVSVISLSVCLVADQIHCAVNRADSCMMLVELVFWASLILHAVETPFVIRFGSRKGNIIRGFCLIALLFALVICVLFSMSKALGWIASLAEFVLKLSEGDLSREMLWICAVAPLIALPLYFASYKLSCRLYRKGAECFDR